MTKTITLILNWNNPEDTVLVANEVLLHQKASVVIIDNHSSDNSLDYIQKKYQYRSINIVWHTYEDFPLISNTGQPEIYLLSLDRNYGFAGGINKVIRKLQAGLFDYVWLLNNDALPDKDALYFLEQHLGMQPALSFAGSLIADFYTRSLVQCAGVRYFPFLGISKLVLKNTQIEYISEQKISEQKIDFQHGSSLLIRLTHLPEIGLMDETFFLYYEEQDWQYRAQKIGFGNQIVPQSIVFHKGSMSTEHSKYLFFYYYNMSAMMYNLKHNKPLQKTAAFFCLPLIAIYRTRLNFKSFAWAIKGLRHGFLRFHK